MNYGTVIIGNGIAGITAARELRKISNQRIQVVSAETSYFFSRTALMYIYMGHMTFEHTKPYEDWFWEKNKIELVHARVDRVIPNENSLVLSTQESLKYDKLLIATGSKTKYYNWKGQDLQGVRGLYSFQDLEYLEENTPAPFQKDHPTKKAVIIGAGLIAVELAEMLITRNIHVTILVRESRFWEPVLTAYEGNKIGRHIKSHGVELKFNTEIEEILGDGNRKVRGVKLKSGDEIECQIVGITTGVAPNIDFLKDSGIEIDKGILVNDLLQTNFSNIYAAGDCAQMRETLRGRKPIEAVWYVGRMMGEVAAANLGGETTAYKPGHWFNSAKFFDIEYQTYGEVLPDAKGIQKHFFWKAKNENKFMTIAFHPETNEFLGINTFGIRLRHEYFDNVLKKKMDVGKVIGGIRIANFDAEFYTKWYKSLNKDFERETGIKTTAPSMLKKLLLR